MPKKNSNVLSKSYLVTGAVIAMMLTAVFVFRQDKQQVTTVVNEPDQKNIATPAPTEVLIQPVVAVAKYPSGWLKYENKKYGYSFAYPDGMKVNGYDYTAFIQEKNNSSYFVIKGIDAIGGVEVMKMALTEAMQVLTKYESNSVIPRRMTLEEITFNGYSAVKFEYEVKTENGDFVGNTHILIENNGVTYNLFWNKGNLTEISFENLGERILSSFRLN